MEVAGGFGNRREREGKQMIEDGGDGERPERMRGKKMI